MAQALDSKLYGKRIYIEFSDCQDIFLRWRFALQAISICVAGSLSRCWGQQRIAVLRARVNSPFNSLTKYRSDRLSTERRSDNKLRQKEKDRTANRLEVDQFVPPNSSPHLPPVAYLHR